MKQAPSMKIKLPVGKIRKAVQYPRGTIELKVWRINGIATANILGRDTDPEADLEDHETLTRGVTVESDATGLVKLEMNLIDGNDDYVETNVQVFVFAGEAYTKLPKQFESELARAVYMASHRRQSGER